MREHNQLKKASCNASLSNQARKARQCCHQHFWQYAKELFDDNVTNQTPSHFGQDVAFDYFKDVYSSTPHIFSQPDWMPTPQKNYPVMRLMLVSCWLPSSTPNPHPAPPLSTRFPTLSSTVPLTGQGPPQPVQLLLVPSCVPTRVEACGNQTGWEGLSCRRSH